MSKTVKTSRTKVLAFLPVLIYDRRYLKRTKRGEDLCQTQRNFMVLQKQIHQKEAKQNLEIDIKYYVTKILIGKVNSRKYGIEIIKEEKQGNTTTKERSKINGLSNNERVIKNLLELLMKNRVTPMSTEEVIDDLRRNPQVIYDML